MKRILRDYFLGQRTFNFALQDVLTFSVIDAMFYLMMTASKCQRLVASSVY